jgi:hypothetical protein
MELTRMRLLKESSTERAARSSPVSDQLHESSPRFDEAIGDQSRDEPFATCRVDVVDDGEELSR